MNATSTIPDLLDDPATIESDGKAVEDFAFRGVPLDPVIRDRVRARSERATERVYQRHGIVNIEEILRNPTSDDE